MYDESKIWRHQLFLSIYAPRVCLLHKCKGKGWRPSNLLEENCVALVNNQTISKPRFEISMCLPLEQLWLLETYFTHQDLRGGWWELRGVLGGGRLESKNKKSPSIMVIGLFDRRLWTLVPCRWRRNWVQVTPNSFKGTQKPSIVLVSMVVCSLLADPTVLQFCML